MPLNRIRRQNRYKATSAQRTVCESPWGTWDNHENHEIILGSFTIILVWSSTPFMITFASFFVGRKKAVVEFPPPPRKLRSTSLFLPCQAKRAGSSYCRLPAYFVLLLLPSPPWLHHFLFFPWWTYLRKMNDSQRTGREDGTVPSQVRATTLPSIGLKTVVRQFRSSQSCQVANFSCSMKQEFPERAVSQDGTSFIYRTELSQLQQSRVRA